MDAVTGDNRRAEMKSPQKELSGIGSEGLAPIFFPKAHLGRIYLFTSSLSRWGVTGRPRWMQLQVPAEKDKKHVSF